MVCVSIKYISIQDSTSLLAYSEAHLGIMWQVPGASLCRGLSASNLGSGYCVGPTVHDTNAKF